MARVKKLGRWGFPVRRPSRFPKPVRPFQLTSDLELVNGRKRDPYDESIRHWLVSSLGLATAIFAADSAGPVITVRKGTSLEVDVQEIGGAAGAAATSVLKNDIQLSGAIIARRRGASYHHHQRHGLWGIFHRAGDRENRWRDPAKGLHRRDAPNYPSICQRLNRNPDRSKRNRLTRVAFVADRTGHKEIYTCDYDGANVSQLTHDKAISVSPALSADGRRLAYTGYQSGYADIYLIDLGSGTRNRIIKFPGTNSGAAFSPDGNRIACTLSKDGNPEIYVTGINGDSPFRLTRSRGVESSPTWSPNGSEIIYSSDERGNPQLYRISAGGGSGHCCRPGSATIPSRTGLRTAGKWFSTPEAAADFKSPSLIWTRDQPMWRSMTVRVPCGVLIRGISFFLEGPDYICLILSLAAKHVWWETSGEYPSRPGPAERYLQFTDEKIFLFSAVCWP